MNEEDPPIDDEPRVIINGHELSLAQSMTLRVAVGSFIMACEETQKEEASPIWGHYIDRCKEIEDAMHYPKKGE